MLAEAGQQEMQVRNSYEHLKATQASLPCWNSRIRLLKLVSPAVSGAIKTVFGGGACEGAHDQGYSLAPGPGSQNAHLRNIRKPWRGSENQVQM